MFVQMICKDRNEKEMNELYEVLGLIARREEVIWFYVPIPVMQAQDFMHLW